MLLLLSEKMFGFSLHSNVFRNAKLFTCITIQQKKNNENIIVWQRCSFRSSAAASLCCVAVFAVDSSALS